MLDCIYLCLFLKWCLYLCLKVFHLTNWLIASNFQNKEGKRRAKVWSMSEIQLKSSCSGLSFSSGRVLHIENLKTVRIHLTHTFSPSSDSGRDLLTHWSVLKLLYYWTFTDLHRFSHPPSAYIPPNRYKSH